MAALLSTFRFRYFLYTRPKLKPPYIFSAISSSASFKPLPTPKGLKLPPRFPPYLHSCHCSSSPLTDSDNKTQTLLLSKDERAVVNGSPPVENTSTIAAIVTSIGGPPGAVGIVRLSGPSAVAIVGRVFRPSKRKSKKKSSTSTTSPWHWRPTSHVIEYGVVLDPNGNVVDEVLSSPLLSVNVNEFWLYE